MTKQPPMHELEFLKRVPNYAEMDRKLNELGVGNADIVAFGKHVCLCWLTLAMDHLKEAKLALTLGAKRSVYSRSYYSVYNASKAVRYIYRGHVSLRSDDHGKASVDLPEDLEGLADWSQKVTTLYTHRLSADYDNWRDTADSFTLSPADAIEQAEEFYKVVREYLSTKYGIQHD
jgi:hypothetical protein